MAFAEQNQQNIERQAVTLLGLKQETIGKTQARQEFLPLVDKLEKKLQLFKLLNMNTL